MLPIDLSEVLGIVFGCGVAAIPLLGLVLRFGLKPALEAYARAHQVAPDGPQVARLERRVLELEQTLRAMDRRLELAESGTGSPLDAMSSGGLIKARS